MEAQFLRQENSQYKSDIARLLKIGQSSDEGFNEALLEEIRISYADQIAEKDRTINAVETDNRRIQK
jgi:hypothetical protein